MPSIDKVAPASESRLCLLAFVAALAVTLLVDRSRQNRAKQDTC